MEGEISLFFNRREKRIEVVKLLSEKGLNDLRDICEGLLEGHVYINPNYGKSQHDFSKKSNPWLADPFNDRTWRFNFQNLLFLEYLIDGGIRFNNKKYIKKAMEILQSWVDNNYEKSESEFAWHDHATALRLIIISNLFNIAEHSRLLNKDIKIRYEQIVQFHCSKLLDDDFYMEKHNHGLDQDVALYTASIVFSHLEESIQWRDVSLERMWKQINQLFASDGSYLEHSPHYVIILFNRLYHLRNFMLDYDSEKKQSEKMTCLLAKVVKFLTVTLTPTGNIAVLGDSEGQKFDLDKLKWDNIPHLDNLKYLISNGNQGEEADSKDHFFPDGGFVISRNKWLNHEDTVQLLFASGFHSRVHKHHDDLAFTLCAHGIPLITDSGKYLYDYKSEKRQYVVSGYGHNSVVVDKGNSDIKRLNIGKSGIIDYYADERVCYSKGIHCLYPGVTHQRVMVFLKSTDVLVIDKLDGYKDDHIFEQVFNFHPSVDCHVVGEKVICQVNGKEVSISPLISDENLKIKLDKGQTDPYLGWVSYGYGDFLPVYNLRLEQVGKNKGFVTHISLETNLCKISNVKWENETVSFDFKDEKYKVIMGETHSFFSINDVIMNTHKVDKPIISDAILFNREYDYRNKYREERNRRLRYQEKLEETERKLKLSEKELEDLTNSCEQKDTNQQEHAKT